MKNSNYLYGITLGLIKASQTDALPLIISVFYVIFALAALASIGVYGVPIAGTLSLLSTFLASAILVVGIVFLRELFAEKPNSPFSFAKSYFGQKADPHAIARPIPLIIAVSIFLPVFSALKGSTSLFVEYQWDAFWIEADRWIHGQDAWRLIHPVVGFPVVTFVLGVLYIVWLPLILVSLVYFSFLTRRPDLRTQFLVTYFSCWALLGSICAIAFASVGPCFVHPFLGRDEFLPLMDYLQYADSKWPIWVIDIQDLLAKNLAEGDKGLGVGITAMPSMHVSMACLYWLAARRLSSWLGWLMLAYLIAILVGSVHLAYHYAVDGYVSIILTVMIWKTSGYFAARKHARLT